VLNEIRRIFSSLRSRLRGHRNSRAVILHPSRQQRGFDPAWRASTDDRNGHAAHGEGNIMADSVEQLFAPHQMSEDHVEYRSIDPMGNTLNESEEWRRENNSMCITRRKRRVITCSQAVVEPHQIHGKCNEPGCGFTHEFYRCLRCGRGYCHHHAFVINRADGPGILILCEDCLQGEIAAHNVWNAMDRANGKIPRPAIFPETPYSVSILSQSNGGGRS
jgi:hypothetical protein